MTKYKSEKLATSNISELGILLRAERNCFFYSPALNAFLRIHSVNKKESIFELEICPKERIREVCDARRTQYHQKGIQYIVWRDNPAIERSVANLPLSKDVKDYIKYRLDCETGTIK